MRVMVTGGAGYIGAHASHLLAARGDYVLIADDLVTGSALRVPGFPLVQVDLAHHEAEDLLYDVLSKHRIDAVIHFAARKQVAESVERPAWYHQQNVGGLAELLLAMERAGVARLIFSSSASVYGDANGSIAESHQTVPVNPYGATKLIGERLLSDASRAWGLRAASLRYFNVGGAALPELGDTQALNLIPIVFQQIALGERPTIFGDDYATPDGTCVRDYVHVSDVAEAHLAVLDALGQDPGHEVFNIGTGRGTSVREMVDVISRTASSGLDPEVRGRRAGDPAAVVAVVDKIRNRIGWEAQHTLEEIVQSAWESQKYFRDHSS